MTLAPLKLVLTAAGCPGASTLIRMLKANGEREIVIHGVDVRPDAVGHDDARGQQRRGRDGEDPAVARARTEPIA